MKIWTAGLVAILLLSMQSNVAAQTAIQDPHRSRFRVIPLLQVLIPFPDCVLVETAPLPTKLSRKELEEVGALLVRVAEAHQWTRDLNITVRFVLNVERRAFVVRIVAYKPHITRSDLTFEVLRAEGPTAIWAMRNALGPFAQLFQRTVHRP